MEEKKKKLTLAAGIINIVITLAFDTLTFITFINNIIGSIAFLVSLTTFILSIFVMKNWKKPNEEYSKQGGLVITTLVIQAILVILMVILSTIISVIFILFAAVLIMTWIFILVDFCNAKKRVAVKEKELSGESNIPVGPKKNRPFTLIATIVNVVIAAVSIGFYGFYMFLFTGLIGFTIISAIFLINILFAAAILIISALLIGKWNAPVEVYNKKFGLFITLFVCDCIAVLLGIINICTGNYFSILTTLVYAMCGTFIMIDVCRNRKITTKSQGSEMTEESKKSEVVPGNTAQKEDSEVEKLRVKLQELKEMKELGILSDEEYDKLKSKIVDKADL